MFFDQWHDLVRIVVVGALAFFALVAVLRTSGKRTLAKMNAFDFVVTVALGSTLATVLLSSDVSLAEGVLALCLLVTLQYVVAWLSVRSPRFEAMVKSEPRLLARHGELLRRALRDERLTEEEVLAALRSSGLRRLEQAEAIVLETDGSISVVRRGEGPAATLRDVAGPS